MSETRDTFDEDLRMVMSARSVRRTPEAEQQIADARADGIDIDEHDEQAQRAKDGREAALGSGPRILCDVCQLPTEPGLEQVAARHQACSPILCGHRDHDPAEPSVTLTGPRLAAYLRLEAAARAAQAAQASLASTGQELRDAIGELCKAVTSG